MPSRRVVIAWAGATSLVLIAASGLLLARREESLDGRRLSAWARDLESTEPSVRMAAVRTLATAAPRSPAAAHALLDALADSSENDVHGTVAEALVRLGPEARVAVPRLTTLLTDKHPKIRAQAATTLGQIAIATEAPVLPLGRALSDPDSGVRMAAASALGRLGASAAPARSNLVIAARDSSSMVRLEAMRALAGIPGDTIVLRALLRGLDDPLEQVRRAAIYGIAEYGSSAPTAVPALRRALGSRDFGMREVAAFALGRIGPPAAAAVPELRRTLRDSDSTTRVTAANALARILGRRP